LFHRVRGRRVVVVGDGDMAEAKRRLVERAGGIPCGETEAHHAALAFVALDDVREAETVATRLRDKGLLVNVADRPALCDFTTPSILDREPVLVAIATSGASAGLAKQLRLRLERIFPHSLGALARALNAARERMRERWPDTGERRHALDTALSEGGVLDPLDERSPERVDRWIDGAGTTSANDTIEILLRSDDPDSLTVRQARLLGAADTVLHDPEIPAAILDRARADAVRRPLPCDEAPPTGLTIVLRQAGDR